MRTVSRRVVRRSSRRVGKSFQESGKGSRRVVRRSSRRVSRSVKRVRKRTCK